MKNGEFLIPIGKFNLNLLMHLKLNECNANDGDKRKYLAFIPCIWLTYKYTENSNITL